MPASRIVVRVHVWGPYALTSGPLDGWFVTGATRVAEEWSTLGQPPPRQHKRQQRHTALVLTLPHTRCVTTTWSSRGTLRSLAATLTCASTGTTNGSSEAGSRTHALLAAHKCGAYSVGTETITDHGGKVDVMM